MSYHKAPGDLGRRIAYLRENLGLSREELAERAGMVPGFVRYLEEMPSLPDEGTLLQLAAALETTAGELLGGGADRPPGGGRPSRRPVLESLDRDECLRLIAPGGVGRVAFGGPSGTIVMPVNYAYQDGAIVFRTQAGGPLDEGLRTGVAGVEIKIAFEVDRMDDAQQAGWSVLVRGPAHHMTAEEIAGASGVAPEPWAGGRRDVWVRVVLHEVTGRRIRAF